jgi:hypothetical protein
MNTIYIQKEGRPEMHDCKKQVYIALYYVLHCISKRSVMHTPLRTITVGLLRFTRASHLGEMPRTIALPTEIQPEKVQVTYKHGILTLQIPNSEAAKPKQIEVKVKEA